MPKAKRVLVVEDDEDILEALELVLESEGHHVRAEKTGNNVPQAIAAFDPELIILDMVLAGVNGLTICNSLKLAEETKGIEIIMISAHPGAAKLTKAAGADKFLAKPFDLAELTGMINN